MFLLCRCFLPLIRRICLFSLVWLIRTYFFGSRRMAPIGDVARAAKGATNLYIKINFSTTTATRNVAIGWKVDFHNGAESRIMSLRVRLMMISMVFVMQQMTLANQLSTWYIKNPLQNRLLHLRSLPTISHRRYLSLCKEKRMPPTLFSHDFRWSLCWISLMKRNECKIKV